MKYLKYAFLLVFLICPVCTSGYISTLDIYPSPVELSEGDSFLLQAVGRNEEGVVVPLQIVSWSVEPEELGRFSSINTIKTTFTAEKKGKGKLTVKYGDILCEKEIIIYDTFPPYNDLWPVRSSEQ